MSTETTPSPSNVYVDLDALPASLKLTVGQNLIFIRAFSSAGDAFLRSLKLPKSCFVSAGKIDYGTRFPGQPDSTYVVGLALVNATGTGLITIQFESRAECSSSPIRTVRLPFTVSA